MRPEAVSDAAPSIVNFRDLATAADRLRPGSLFRSGSLSELSLREARVLSGQLRIEAYCDLRTDAEIARQGLPTALVAAGVRWRRFPIANESDPFFAVRHPTAENYAWLYLRTLTQGARPLALLLKTLSRSTAPAVFGCTAGKDRTGVVAALLLALSGIPDALIVEDYAARGFAPWEIEYLFRRANRANLNREEFALRIRPRKASMRRFLSLARGRYGSLREYAARGLADRDAAALKARLTQGPGVRVAA